MFPNCHHIFYTGYFTKSEHFLHVHNINTFISNNFSSTLWTVSIDECEVLTKINKSVQKQRDTWKRFCIFILYVFVDRRKRKNPRTRFFFVPKLRFPAPTRRSEISFRSYEIFSTSKLSFSAQRNLILPVSRFSPSTASYKQCQFNNSSY